jgi:hypothetical protein
LFGAVDTDFASIMQGTPLTCADKMSGDVWCRVWLVVMGSWLVQARLAVDKAGEASTECTYL